MRTVIWEIFSGEMRFGSLGMGITDRKTIELGLVFENLRKP